MADLFENRDRFRISCCCGSFHAEAGACVIANFFELTIAFWVFMVLYRPEEFFNAANILAILFFLVITESILIAQKLRQPLLYLPYLIFTTITTVLLLALGLVLIFAPQNVLGRNSTNYTERLLYAAIVVAGAALNSWLLRIVDLAYKFMRSENIYGNSV